MKVIKPVSETNFNISVSSLSDTPGAAVERNTILGEPIRDSSPDCDRLKSVLKCANRRAVRLYPKMNEF